jgi:hypothetical protein
LLVRTIPIHGFDQIPTAQILNLIQEFSGRFAVFVLGHGMLLVFIRTTPCERAERALARRHVSRLIVALELLDPSKRHVTSLAGRPHRLRSAVYITGDVAFSALEVLFRFGGLDLDTLVWITGNFNNAYFVGGWYHNLRIMEPPRRDLSLSITERETSGSFISTT